MLQTDDAQSEPTSTFTLHINCGRQALDRSYLVMLDPAPVGESAPVITSEPATDVLPIRPDEAVPEKRKHSTSQTVAAASSAPPPAEAIAPLAVPATKRSKRAARKEVPSTLLAGIADQTRLYIDGGGDMPKPPPQPVPGTPEYSAQLEQRVATLQSLQGKLEADIADLQHTLTMLHQQSDRLDARDGATGGAQPASPPATQAAPAVTLQRHPAAEHAATAIPAAVAAQPWQWWLFALLGIGGIAGVVLWWRQRRSDMDFDTRFDANTLQDRSADIGSMMHRRPAQASAFINSQLSPGSIEVEETMPDADERAQMLLVHGEVTAAIEELQHAIDMAPEDVERWFLLFRIFRHQGMKTDYANLARRFRAMHAGEEDWELVRNIGNRLDPENPLYAEPPGQPALPRTRDADLEMIAPLQAAAAAARPAEKPLARPPDIADPRHEPVLDFLGSNEVDETDDVQTAHIDMAYAELDTDSDDDAALYAQPPLLGEVDFDPETPFPDEQKKY